MLRRVERDSREGQRGQVAEWTGVSELVEEALRVGREGTHSIVRARPMTSLAR